MIKEITFEVIKHYWKTYLWAKYTTNIHEVDNHTQKNYSYRVMQHLSREKIDEMIKPTYIGYFVNDKIVGVESGYKSNTDYYRLRGLWVNEDYRGHGIATKLLKYLEVRCDEKYLWTCPRESALNFYLRYGFKVTGTSEKTLYGQNYFALKRNKHYKIDNEGDVWDVEHCDYGQENLSCNFSNCHKWIVAYDREKDK